MIGLVACSASKLRRPAPARELYTGPLFRAASEHAARECERWYVLSATHGVLGPAEIVVPYDSRGARLDRAWAHQVARQLHARGESGPFLVLAGKGYRRALAGVIAYEHHPTHTMGNGEQQRWYAHAAGRQLAPVPARRAAIWRRNRLSARARARVNP